ncbi:Terpenoid synthase [Penicillium griseofulvum]|uniref:Terpenoid synthase n=1 Tax=Penicillium patulum TaxID=5078 RepID=A0A135LJ77_PENPA|nr:Terpenoid synthase [Penicillium griseofulvum]KXG48999.1 Terpenoid synthase [Penicillium griseofulvum]
MSEPAQRKSEAQAKIAAEFLRLDPTFGSWFLPFWRTWTKATEDIRKLEFASLDEYLKSRVVDVSGSWTLAILQWGTGIYLTPGEEKIIGPINYIAYAELALVNDLFSWEKEKAAYIKSGETIPVVNAVQIVMTSKMLTESAAKEVVRSELTVHEERFCQLRDQYKTTSNPSRSILRILELLEHAMAGNYVWSIRCPRYAKSDRNPYRDYIETFGSEKVPVISPQASIFESTSEATNCADTIEPKQLDMLAIEEKVLMKTSLGNDLQDEASSR